MGHPAVLFELLAWLVRHNCRKPKHLVKSLLLMPRALDIFFDLSANPPDVVHLFWGHYPAIVGHLIQRHLPRVVLSIFLGAYDLLRGFPGSAQVARGADVVWTHARVNVPEILRFGAEPDRIRIAYRGIDVSRFQPHSARKIPQRIVTAGRLSAAKGMAEVLTIFRRVHERWPDASLIVLGDGPDRDRLQSAANSDTAREAVRFRGHVSHDTVAREMAQAEIFLFMSKQKTERLPNVVKEAMSCGCICIVTKTPGVDELVSDGVSGFVIPQGDIETAVQRISEVFRNPRATHAMQATARKHVMERFDVVASMRTYHQHWLRLVAEKRDGHTSCPAATHGAGEA
jgi:glycosyltransferase involved in cell wall biosynthesis